MHHPYFGARYKLVFTITYVLYLIDAFIMMSVPQLFFIVLLITMMIFWEQIVVQKHIMLIVITRLI